MTRLLTRRMFLSRLGKGTAAVAVLGIAACGDDGASPTTAPAPAATTRPPPPTDASPTTAAPAPSTTTAQPTTTGQATTTASPAAGEAGVEWERVNLGFVSAYVVARGGRGAVVDTGVPGSAGAIEQGVAALGIGWGEVDHVILTHFHGDHVGSVAAVLALAADAAVYAGEADIGEIASPRPLTAVGDGDEVFGLQIVATPGHTPGHVSVYDPAGGLLIAGDALNGGDAMGGAAGKVAGPNPQFTPDMATAEDSVRKLAQLTYDTLLFGHGEPVVGNASALVAALAADL